MAKKIQLHLSTQHQVRLTFLCDVYKLEAREAIGQMIDGAFQRVIDDVAAYEAAQGSQNADGSEASAAPAATSEGDPAEASQVSA